MERPVNWGILSAGLISQDFANALILNCPGAVVYAVGARSQEKADEFGKKFGCQACYSSYEALVQDPKVDIIYVGTIHPHHKAAVELAQKNGKAVLCEKPFTLNTLELNDLVKTSRDKKLYLSEAMWTRYFPAIKKVNELITTKAIGDVVQVHGLFGFALSPSSLPRCNDSSLGGGALDSPIKISATSVVKDGVDYQTSMILTFPTGHATLSCGITSGYFTNDVDIIGTKGAIKIKAPFHCPTNIVVTIGDKVENLEFPLPEHDKKIFHYNNSLGLSYQAQAVQKAFLEGKLESEEIPLDESVKIMKTMDEIRAQIGVTYSAEQRNFTGFSQ